MIETHHRFGDPLDGPVVLLNDVDQVFGLAHDDDVDAGVLLDAFDGGCISNAIYRAVSLMWRKLNG